MWNDFTTDGAVGIRAEITTYPGATHAFDILQRDATGRVQGGFRLVTVASH